MKEETTAMSQVEGLCSLQKTAPRSKSQVEEELVEIRSRVLAMESAGSRVDAMETELARAVLPEAGKEALPPPPPIADPKLPLPPPRPVAEGEKLEDAGTELAEEERRRSRDQHSESPDAQEPAAKIARTDEATSPRVWWHRPPVDPRTWSQEPDITSAGASPPVDATSVEASHPRRSRPRTSL